MQACDHCMLEVPDREAVVEEINGRRMIFCCLACSGIYRLIRNEGLEAFYAKRKEWKPGPSEEKTVDTALFLEGLRPAGDDFETDIAIDGIRCASCVWLNEKILEKTPGVSRAIVNYATHRARIRWDPAKTDIAAVLSRITSIGYTPKPLLAGHLEEAQKRQSRDLLIRFGTAAFFSMQLMLFSTALYAGYFQGIEQNIRTAFHWISLVLTTPVVFYSGWPILHASIRGFRNRAFNMDVLIAAGTLAAYGYSIFLMADGGEVYFDTAAMIITLILLGRYIEHGARANAASTITRLLQLSPKQARIVEEAGTRMVPVASIRPGDLVEVIPGEKIPLDGVVVRGTSEVDESMLTGESKPMPKIPDARVFSGTINLFGSFVFRVERIGKDTVLAQIIQAVEDAQARRAPIQSTAERVIGWFVPAVLVIAVVTFVGWAWSGAALTNATMNAVAVLVIACPCALGLATPLAILIGTSGAAAKGILIKGGDVIEKAASVNFVILDKTGTITEGKPLLTAYRASGIPDAEALRLALSLEKQSEHSLGRAIADAARGIEPYTVADFIAIPGKGIKGTINGKATLIGSREFIESEGLSVPADSGQDHPDGQANTIVFLAHDNTLAGMFAIADAVRKESHETINLLKQAGLGTAMVTGDIRKTAEAVAKQAGIETVEAGVSPIQKAVLVQNLEARGMHVLMAGDGINDAPALVQASVGVAMGRATDIALESADMVIMRPDLRLIPLAIALSRTTFSVIRQNIFWAFFYNVIAIPLAVAGLLHPIVAAGAMAFSSLSVVGNSLRARVR